MFVSRTRSLVTGYFSILMAIASFSYLANAAEKEFSLIDSAKPRQNCCGKASTENSVTLNYPDAATYRLTATYYSTRGGLKTTLMLNNKAPGPVFAVPTIYSLAGTRLSLTPISVPGASYLDVDLNQLLAGVADEFREGSMKISYDGISQQLGAQVKMVDESNGLIWAEQFVYASKLVSSRLENLWWLPFPNSETKVVVSNTSSGTVTATLTVDGTSPGQAQISLAPWETRVLDILQDIAGRQNGHVHDEGGISITHSGAPGAVLARMYISKPNKGYSAAVNFIDPEATGSQRWHGNGLRLRNVDGQKVDPVVAFRNVGSQASNVTGRIIYTRPDGETADIILPSQTINAGQTKSLDLKILINGASLPSSVTYGGIEIEYDTPNGSLITSVQSLSPNGEHVFQVPMFEPTNMPSSAGGFPWKANGNFTTVVYIKNETNSTRKYTAHLSYTGGAYSLGMKELKAGQTVEIDFRKLRDDQSPGDRGEVIPLTVDTGQIAWSAHGIEMKTMSGRSEQISLASGVASTYACANPCPNVIDQVSVEPVEFNMGVGDTEQLVGWQTELNSYGQSFGPYISQTVTWQTFDTGIATTGVSDLEAVSPGTTNLQGTFERYIYINWGGYCEPFPDHRQAEAPVDVILINILRNGQTISGTNSPTTVSVGEQIALTAYVSGGTPTSKSWTVPGNRIANYDPSLSTQQKTDLTSNDLSQNYLTYYWVDGADNREVRYTVTINDRPYTARAKFNVKRPTSTMSATTATVTLGNAYIGLTNQYFGLWFGQPDDPSPTKGITFTASITKPSGMDGDFYLVQKINSASRSKTPVGGSQVTRSGTNLLDGTFHYGNANQSPDEDSPGISLSFASNPCDYTQVAANDSFSMYLVYKPTVSGSSIYVPLRKLNWSWAGSGTTSNCIGSGSWSLSNASPNTPTAISSSTTEEFPEWSGNSSSLNF
jgi:hypothetical protein